MKIEQLQNEINTYTEEIREAYTNLVKAFEDAGLEPNIHIWLHYGANEGMTKNVALGLTHSITGNSTPSVTHYDQDTSHKYTHVGADLYRGQFNISCPLDK